ncbi:MAG: hypothetical protein ACD_24C00214G0002 [uncultured bacterium]|nr:MAG: hypothetical protein ACD_24C00214G0002 [uncultured bacterium]
MADKFIVRKADLSDFSEFYELLTKTLSGNYFLYSKNSQAFTLDEDLPREDLKKYIKEGKRLLYLAYSKNKAIGYLLTFKTRAGVAFAHWLAVDSAYQKHGVASSLLLLWEKGALEEGAHILQLWTTKNDIPFYLNRGFKKGGSFPQSWFGVDHYLFYKILRKPNEKVFLRDYLAKKPKPKKES